MGDEGISSDSFGFSLTSAKLHLNGLLSKQSEQVICVNAAGRSRNQGTSGQL